MSFFAVVVVGSAGGPGAGVAGRVGCKVIPRSGWAQPDPRYSFDVLRASRRAAQISKLLVVCRLERLVFDRACESVKGLV